MLKADLHIHVKGDPIDKISYSVFDLIDEAKKKEFDVLGITPHLKLFENKRATEYAKKKGIILIPGVEIIVEGKDVLVYNASKDVEKVKTFEELCKYKKKHPEALVVAPHPFFHLSCCLGNKIFEYLDLFDAWEFSFFYNKMINPNKKVLNGQKPVIGNSDVHDLKNLGRTYTMISAKKNAEDIIKAIRENQVVVITNPMSFFGFMKKVFSLIT